MISLISTVLLGLIKLVLEIRAKKRLNEAEFLAHIRAHQIRKKNIGKAATSFEEALEQAQKELDLAAQGKA